MLDKQIVERMQACTERAEELTGVRGTGDPQYFASVIDVALALFREGYRGPVLDLIADINTLKDRKSGYLYAGNPSFMGLFGRDSLIASWQLLDYDPMIARNTLLILANLQGERMDRNTGEQPGKILHEYYDMDSVDAKWWKKYKADIEWLKVGVPVYFSVDSTPLFIIVYNLYKQKTHDKYIVDLLRDNVLRAHGWMVNHGVVEDNVFLGYDYDKRVPGLRNQSWKDSDEYEIRPPVMPVEAQGYYYAAMIPDAFKKRFRRQFSKEFWMEHKQYFAFALDGDGERVCEVTSNPGHLLFTGILDKKHEKKVVKKLFSDELWTPYGIRTLSMDSELFNPCSYHSGSVWPHDNWIIAQGLKQCGYEREYVLVKNALLRAYNELGYIPEYYGVISDKILKLPACLPQAWSSGALLNFVLEEGK